MSHMADLVATTKSKSCLLTNTLRDVTFSCHALYAMLYYTVGKRSGVSFYSRVRVAQCRYSVLVVQSTEGSRFLLWHKIIVDVYCSIIRVVQ